MTRLTSKAGVLLLTLTAAGVILVAASRAWVSGTVDDAVLGARTLEATGTQAAPGLSALALVVAAAGVALVTTGRLAARVALVVLTGAALGGAWLAARALLDPRAVLGPLAAAAAGRTGTLETHAAATPWPWAAVLGVVLAGGTVLAGVRGRARWAGLPSRYERGAAEPETQGATGPRGERTQSQWDELSAGLDPTDVGPDRQT